MSEYKVDFATLDWDDGRHGVRQKVFCRDSQRMRLVEFLSGEGFDEWCEAGHIGYVLEGGLEIDFDGDIVNFVAGDGLFIPKGRKSRHRSPSIKPGTILLMIEEL